MGQSVFSRPESSRNPTDQRSFHEARLFVAEHGVDGIGGFYREQLDALKNVELNFLITGDSGAGKSSFINAIRGLRDYDDGAAAVGVNETTKEPTPYRHPFNPKIVFWDVPGIGTPGYPNITEYCKKIDLEKYDAFLFFCRGRFTAHDLELAKKSKSIGKPFFFVRAHIGTEVSNAMSSEQNFNEDDKLEIMRNNCHKYLQELLTCETDIYLIDNKQKEKWEFDRLIAAISNVLPERRRQCFILSLSNVTRDFLKRKAKVLRDIVKMYLDVFKQSGSMLFHISEFKESMNLFIRIVVECYRYYLGLPEKDSVEFEIMPPEPQEKIRSFYWTEDMDIDFNVWIESFNTAPRDTQGSSFMRWLDEAYAKAFEPLRYTFKGLNCLLDAMEESALAVLEDRMITKMERNEERRV